MSTAVAQARIKDALKELKIAWTQAKQHWDDTASTKFEEEFLSPIDGKASAAIGAMGRLSEILDAARRACDKDR